MDVVDLPLEQIIPYARNPRRNEQAIATVAASIQEFGWRQPIVVDEAMVVLAGHTRLEAARKLGFKTAPVHVAKGLTVSQARAFRIMDNRSSENAEWDKDLLNLELADLLEADFDLGLTGFTDDELNALMSSLEEGAGPQTLGQWQGDVFVLLGGGGGRRAAWGGGNGGGDGVVTLV